MGENRTVFRKKSSLLPTVARLPTEIHGVLRAITLCSLRKEEPWHYLKNSMHCAKRAAFRRSSLQSAERLASGHLQMGGRQRDARERQAPRAEQLLRRLARLPSKRRCAGCRARRSAGGAPDEAAFEPHSLLRRRGRADRLWCFVDPCPVRSRADQRIVDDPHRWQWHFSAALRRGHCRGRGAAAQKYETQINREVSP